MKKILILIAFCFSIAAANATNVVVESMSNVDKTANKTQLKAKVLETAELDSGVTFLEGTILNCEVLKVVDAKRGKRAGYLVIHPISIEYQDVVQLVKDENIEAKVTGYSKKDWKEVGINAGLTAGLTAGSHFVPGLSQAFYFSKGLLHPADDKSRLNSAVTSVYENSPFAYISKGQEIDIEEGDMLVLKFYHADVPKWKVFKRNE